MKKWGQASCSVQAPCSTSPARVFNGKRAASAQFGWLVGSRQPQGQRGRSQFVPPGQPLKLSRVPPLHRKPATAGKKRARQCFRMVGCYLGQAASQRLELGRNIHALNPELCTRCDESLLRIVRQHVQVSRKGRARRSELLALYCFDIVLHSLDLRRKSGTAAASLSSRFFAFGRSKTAF